MYLQSVQAYISPPIAAVFLFGIIWKRTNRYGAMAGMLAGINFLHFAFWLFAACSPILVVVSLFTPIPDKARIKELVISHDMYKVTTPKERVQRNVQVALSAVLFVVIGSLWVIFF